MDMAQTNNAIAASGFTKEINDWIWKKEHKPFEVYE